MAKKKKKQKEQNGTEGTKKENEVDEDLRSKTFRSILNE
jgi:hypothetical protein